MSIRIVTVFAKAIERVFEQFVHALDAPAVGQVTRIREHAGVVKFIVRQQWSIVTFNAARLIDKELQSQHLIN